MDDVRLLSGSTRAALVGVALALCPFGTEAADWNVSSAWLLRGADFELGPEERKILRIEHADGWAYGDNYLFFDVVMPEDTGSGAGTTLYGEFVPRFSLGKISGRELVFGPVKDMLLTGAINAGQDFRAYLYGASVDLAMPGFAYFQFNAYVRDDQGQSGTTWQVTPVWLLPFTLGKVKLNLQGFIDWAGAEGRAEENLLIVPRLWCDLGSIWGAPGHIEVGVEYLWWKNKFGVDGVTEKVLQPALRWTF
jgi:nucleoside-specific outer membrane channel protein Tsx